MKAYLASPNAPLAVLSVLSVLAGPSGSLAAEPPPPASPPAAAPVPSAARMTVGVLPLAGEAPAPVDRRAGESLVTALRAVGSIEVLSLLDVGTVLGAAAQVALERCTDDPCRLRAVGALQMRRIVAGELTARGVAGWTIRLRLVDAENEAAPVLVRVSREIAEGSLEVDVARAAAELFPEHRQVGVLAIDTRPGATVSVDGKLVGTAPIPPLELAPGTHEVRVEASGYFPYVDRVEVALGRRTLLEAGLIRSRSTSLPLMLGGGAVVAGALGLALGAVAKGIASDWTTACPDGGACAAGFTAARYEDDESKIALRRTAANVLFGVGAALAVGAVVSYFTGGGEDVPPGSEAAP